MNDRVEIFTYHLRRCLIVSGSRSFKGSKYEDAAKKKLESGIAWYFKKPQNGDCIFVGDAEEGPDSWVAPILVKMDFGIDVWVFRGSTGELVTPDGLTRWISDSALLNLDMRSRFLARNAQMTSMAALMCESQMLLAISDDGSKTKGTANTVSAAQKLGIPLLHLRYGPDGVKAEWNPAKASGKSKSR